MEAYYYSFEPTGVEAIDRILSAAACAGKAAHHTRDWMESGYTPEHLDGSVANGFPESNSPVAWIQNAANRAARELSEVSTVGDLRAENAKLRAKVERIEKLRDHYRDRLPDGTGNGRAVNAHRVWHDIDAALDGEQSCHKLYPEVGHEDEGYTELPGTVYPATDGQKETQR